MATTFPTPVNRDLNVCVCAQFLVTITVFIRVNAAPLRTLSEINATLE